MEDPIRLFTTWLEKQKANAQSALADAVCLSTIGLDTFPNTRFVSLKDVRDGTFIITGSTASLKGQEIADHPSVALTFWWPETMRQVRIQGTANPITTTLAQLYFNERSERSRAISRVSKQGKYLTSIEELQDKIERTLLHPDALQKPEDWGGYAITPLRMEFMNFKEDRFHERLLFSYEQDNWIRRRLQP
ncbi:pyridoxine/pyridoxamine 5'-phosphate oxidase [Croceiramulus getboli]|nr:pyridoxal 5'-phosphate synthase [Flavobacteriaceae bacterium YJPT1-3]